MSTMTTDTSPEDAQDQVLHLAHALDGGKLIDDSTEWADTLHTAAATLRSLHIEATEQARLLGISAEREMALRARVRELEASRIAYASEFELNADGEPDVGSIHANIRALKSQLSAPGQCLHGISEPSGWMPIETAPKDGRTILFGYRNSLGKWRTMRGKYFTRATIDEEWEEPDECDEGWYETSVEADDVPNYWAMNPTHWMPLPAAPKGGAE